MSKLKDIAGQKFGNLTAIKYLGCNSKMKGAMWECKCDCGNKYITTGNHLRTGHTSHCGCKNKRFGEKNPFYKHGKRNTRLYKIFTGMKQRCYNSNNPKYSNYGGRKITICEEWLNKENGFENFYNWAINNGYADNLTIDRIDNNGNYEPNNCKWSTFQEQISNRTNTVKIEYNNIIKPLTEWARQYKIPITTLRSRLDRGWTVERALNENVHKNFKGKHSEKHYKYNNFEANNNE